LQAGLAGLGGLVIGKTALAGQSERLFVDGKDKILAGASETPGEIFLVWNDNRDKLYDICVSENKLEGRSINTLEKQDDITSIFNYHGEDVRKMTVGGLKPDTDYQVKILGKSGKFDSAIIPVRTTYKKKFKIDGNDGSYNFLLGSVKDIGHDKNRGVYVFMKNGAMLNLDFELYEGKPDKAYFYIDHVSSGSSKSFNGGYSPYSITLNSKFVQFGMSLGRARQEVRFEIEPKATRNKLKIELLDNLKIDWKIDDQQTVSQRISAYTRLWLYKASVECIFGENYRNADDLAKKLK